ncbi:MAG: catalase, partial [Gammaproteobacteria bacterium]|nr:catalase [Gammaproteobacteria bacterium]
HVRSGVPPAQSGSPLCGVRNAVKIAGADQDFHRRDFFEAVTGGDFPTWELAVQLFTEKDAEAFPFDHLDATKLIPEELVPLEVIGEMTLDRWPDNFFAETEQVAFCPANIVPGIDFSNDPLLQGRSFSYLDTQLIRLGGPNFHEIPINAPHCPYANQQRDGHMQMDRPKGRVSYDPSSLQDDVARENPPAGFRSAAVEEAGARGRARAASFADYYSQPRLFWRSQSEYEQTHVVSAFVFELSQVETPQVRERVVALLRHIDESLARRVADGLGLTELPEAPPTQTPAIDMDPSPALQIIGKMKDTLHGRVVGILIADGSDEAAIESVRGDVEKAGASVKLVAPSLGIRLGNDKHVQADAQLAGAPSVMFDAVALLLSSQAATLLIEEAAAVDFVRDAFGHLKAIAVDAGGRMLLQTIGIGPDEGVFEVSNTEGFITAAKTRQWAREASVRQQA